MPKCSYCRESGHTKRTCGKGIFDRLMSIMNNGKDITSISSLPAAIKEDWFVGREDGLTPVSDDYTCVSCVKFTEPGVDGRVYGSCSTEIQMQTMTGLDNATAHIRYLIRVLYWLKKGVFESSWMSLINRHYNGMGSLDKKFVFGSKIGTEYRRYSLNEVQGYEVRLLDDNTFTYSVCRVSESQLHLTYRELQEKVGSICHGLLFIRDERERAEIMEKRERIKAHNQRIRQSRDVEIERVRRERQIELQRLDREQSIVNEQRRQREAEEKLCEVKEKVIEASECPICMDELGPTNKVILRCGHQICGDCIFKHVQNARGTQCPCCRAEYTYRPKGWVPPNNGTPRSSTRPPSTNVDRMRQRIVHLEGFIRDLIGNN